MKYIVYQRFRAKALCGEVNLPAMTECDSVNNIICHDGKPLCSITSQNAHDFFSRDDDGKGMERGKLTHSIMKVLRTYKDPRTDTVYQEKWDKVWNDELCQKYKRTEHADHWLWNHDFFNAPIEDLEYIYNMIKGVA